MPTTAIDDEQRVGFRGLVRSHRRLLWIAAVIAVALAAFVLIWFQPQKLFIEETVTEAAPGTASADEGSDPMDEGSEMGGATKTETLADGDFRSLDHTTTGSAAILELSDGNRFLRIEDLETSNGPDLRVYLSEIPASDDSRAYGEGFVDLGALKGNLGDQNYKLPKDLDLSRYKSAVIWCRRFTVGFGVAPLESL